MSRTVTTILPVTELTVGPVWNGHTGNWDANRLPITRIIIHTMDGSVDGANSRFNDPGSGVSAHYGISLDGRLFHWVDETLVAYHAGDYLTNQVSIGIEHEDGGNFNGPRTDILYQVSGKLVADLCRFYSISCDRQHILKHSEVSDHPTACPDSLDIDRIMREAQGVLNPPKSSPSPSVSPSSSLSSSVSPSPSASPSEAQVEQPTPSAQPVEDKTPSKTPATSFWKQLAALINSILKGLVGVKN